MTCVFYALLVCVVALGIFYFGITVGISDCKRRFQIPHGAVGVNENGYYYD